MSQNDEETLAQFGETGEDDIRPIDIGAPAPAVAPPKEGVVLPAMAESRAAADGVAPSKTHGDSLNRVVKGDYVDVLKKNPALNEVHIGAGWDNKAFEETAIDVDLSCFMLDRNGQTRVNEDFVFYNNDTACDGAVKHTGDNRSGAGDGDDEIIVMDLNGIPFDIVRINFVLSIYDEEFTKKRFDTVREFYLRMVNRDDDNEILRHEIAEADIKGHNAYLVGGLVREGPKWFFEVLASPTKTGLMGLAKGYGIVVKEDTG